MSPSRDPLHPASTTERPFSAAHWAWIAAATAVAAALRFLDLGEWSFWVDEAHTWRDATMPLGDFRVEDRGLYPLTFLAQRFLLDQGWIGTDEAWLRAPFAAAGVLSVTLLAVCGRRLVGPSAAVLSAWFCAINPWHVYWSQNARGYVLAFLCAAVAANRVGRWTELGRPRDLFAALGATAIGCLCHPTAALLAAGLLLFVGLRQVPSLQPRTVAWGALGVVLLVWLLPEAVASWAPFQGFLRSKDDPSLLHFVQTAAYYYRPALLVAAVGGLWLLRLDGARRRSLLLGCLAVVPFLVLMVIGGRLVKTTARYSICAFPVLLWLAAFACTRLAARLAAAHPVGARSAGVRFAGLLLPALLLADFTVHTHRYFTQQHGDRAQWRQACEFVLDRQRQSGRGLWVLTVSDPTVWFYVEPQHWALGPGGGDPRVQVHQLENWKLDGRDAAKNFLHEPGGRAHLHWFAALAARNGAELAVLVTLPELLEKDDGQLWPTLQREFDLVLHLPCFVGPKDESVYVFVPRGT